MIVLWLTVLLSARASNLWADICGALKPCIPLVDIKLQRGTIVEFVGIDTLVGVISHHDPGSDTYCVRLISKTGLLGRATLLVDSSHITPASAEKTHEILRLKSRAAAKQSQPVERD